MTNRRSTVLEVRRRLVITLAVVALFGVACGDTPEPAPDPQATLSPEPPETAPATPSEEPSDTPEPEPKFTVEVTYADGKVKGPDVVEVAVGEKVSIAVTSDAAEEVHVHGYDKMLDLEPGEQGVLRFTADIPGVWEVELEDAGEPLFELQVR